MHEHCMPKLVTPGSVTLLQLAFLRGSDQKFGVGIQH